MRKTRPEATLPFHGLRRLIAWLPVLAGFIAALRSDRGLGEVVNFGSSFEISVGDTAKLIAEVMRADIAVVEDENRIRPANSEVERLYADNTKARALFDWSPVYGGRDGFKRGLMETAKWMANPENLRGYKSQQYNL